MKSNKVGYRPSFLEDSWFGFSLSESFFRKLLQTDSKKVAKIPSVIFFYRIKDAVSSGGKALIKYTWNFHEEKPIS